MSQTVVGPRLLALKLGLVGRKGSVADGVDLGASVLLWQTMLRAVSLDAVRANTCNGKGCIATSLLWLVDRGVLASLLGSTSQPQN